VAILALKRAHIYISGRVQGVFYRSNTRRKALELGLKGWVRNLRDGRVEIVAEGDEERLERLIEWCRRGPPMARVTGLEVRWENPTGEYEDFEVRY
jgi:acylphosphatase